MFAVWPIVAPADEPDPIAAEGAYEDALESWQGGRPREALRYATDATQYDDQQRPARLLAGYALQRVNAPAASEAVLRALVDLPIESALDARVHDLAMTALHRAVDPYRRDQVSLGYHNVTAADRKWQTWGSAPGLGLVVGFPAGGGLYRIDASARFATGTRDVGGWHVVPMVVFAHPISRWSTDLAFGPSIWFARGVWWPDGWHTYVGARAAAGAAVRTGRRTGFRFEAGLSSHFTDRTLDWYASPLDFRVGFEYWPGTPVGPI